MVCGAGGPPGEPAAQPGQLAPEPACQQATHDGKAVHYVDIGGEGPALVLVHGWASDLRVWNAQLEDFPKFARVIAIDLPGHGQSEVPDGEFSMDLFARATAAVMADAGIDKAVLVGHSNGTPVIRQFYRLFPERTQALVVVDGALKGMVTDEIAAGIKARLAADTFQETVFSMIDGVPGDGLSPRAREDIKEIGLAQQHAAVLGGFEAILDTKIWEPDPITAPTLLVLAAQPSWDEEYLDFVKGLAPQAEIHVLEGASHFLMMERPEEFRGLVTGFLKRNGLL